MKQEEDQSPVHAGEQLLGSLFIAEILLKI